MSPFQHALIVARRELKDSLTDWRIVTPVAILTFIFPWLVIYATKFGIGWLERYDPDLVLTRLIPFSVMVVGFFPISFSLVIALESFVGEKERNTLEALLSTPISDGALYLGKLLAALALPLIGSIAAISLQAWALPRVAGQAVPLDLLGQIFCLMVTLALGMVAGAVVVSSNTTSVRAANLLASFILIPAMIMVQFQAMVILWEQLEVLWYVAAAQLLADIALIRMGIRMFNREDLLARTIDRVDLRRAWRTFWRFFRQEPQAMLTREPSAGFSLGRIYRRDIPQILRRNRGALVVVLLLMLGAFGLGWLYAQALPLPPSAAERLEITSDDLRLIVETPGLLGLSPWTIFLWNLRSLVVAALGAIISFGGAAVIPLFVVSGVIGFGVGEVVHLGVNVAPFLALLWPHGILEIPAAMIATAAAFRMGASVLSPPKDFTLGETILSGLADLLKLLIFLVVPILLIAAVVEIYVTPLVGMWFLGG